METKVRLQMNDNARSIVTHIDTNTEIDYKGGFDEKKSEYYYELSINGLKLFYYGSDKQKRCKKDFNKLQTKGARKAYKEPYIDEQEQAHIEALNTYGLKYRMLAGSQSCGNY